jgi:hypothetical protein
MACDIPPMFEGIVEIDEAYLGKAHGGISVKLRVLKEPSGGGAQMNKQYLGFCVVTDRYGQM